MPLNDSYVAAYVLYVYKFKKKKIEPASPGLTGQGPNQSSGQVSIFLELDQKKLNLILLEPNPSLKFLLDSLTCLFTCLVHKFQDQ